MTKHLIMGFATNQKPESLKVFLRSARKVYPTSECDIALITNSVAGIEEILDDAGAIAINTPSTYSIRVSRRTKLYNRAFLHALRGLAGTGALSGSPEIVAGYHQLIETWHHPHFARWFAYMRVMRTLHGYDRILLADTKDVVFQRPFFDRVDPHKVAVFQDGEDFAAEGWNGRWIIEAYGRKRHAAIAHHQPICIGVVAGGAAPLAAFVTQLCTAIARHPFGRIEQAIFNKMYFAGEFDVPFQEFDNRDGPVLTMAGDGVAARTECLDGLIAASGGGRVFPVVHMYDRHEHTDRPVQGRYGA